MILVFNIYIYNSQVSGQLVSFANANNCESKKKFGNKSLSLEIVTTVESIRSGNTANVKLNKAIGKPYYLLRYINSRMVSGSELLKIKSDNKKILEMLTDPLKKMAFIWQKSETTSIHSYYENLRKRVEKYWQTKNDDHSRGVGSTKEKDEKD